MTDAGLIIISIGAIICVPVAVLWMGLLIGPRGPKYEKSIEMRGPNAADLNMAAERRIVDRMARPAIVIGAICAVVGGTLIAVDRWLA